MYIMEDYFNLNVTLAIASYIVNTLNFTDSSTESLNTFSHTHNQTELNETITLSHWEGITRMIHIIVRPILIVCGTVGNMLSFYVMRRGSLKEVFTFLHVNSGISRHR